MSLLPQLLAQPCSSRYASRLHSYFRFFSSTTRRNQVKSAQPQTAATESYQLSSPAAYVSESLDPWFNLSYEDWLLRNTPVDQPVLFIYRNNPCVVIGRNQNPWKETTPRRLREWGIPLLRRRSGGGTVFHDLGNTNFSIILPRILFTRAHGAELVARAIRDRLGIAQCTVNARNDVIIKDGAKELKMSLSLPCTVVPRSLWENVSGSAYKIIQNRAYHHGTMLIFSSLGDLGKALKSDSPNIETKGIPSFRSPVTTLSHYSQQPITHSQFVSSLLAEFSKVYSQNTGSGGDNALAPIGVSEETLISEGADDPQRRSKIMKGVAELKSWEWEYGQSPEFSNLIEGDLSFGKVSAMLTCRHALITSLSFNAPSEAQEPLDALAVQLVGKKYESLDGAEEAVSSIGDDRVGEVIQWLRGNM